MPAFQSIVLTDRATPTPVAHTFTPVSNQGGTATVAESNGTKVGEPRLALTPIAGSSGENGRKYKVKYLFVVPVVATETINGVSSPKVLRNAVVETTFSFDARSTMQERNDVVGMYQSSFDPAKALVHDTVVGLQGIFDGT